MPHCWKLVADSYFQCSPCVRRSSPTQYRSISASMTAAQLAAYYSQARTSSQVPVDYTLIKHVRKPNGAKPGFVIYDHQKTLYITPDESYINRLERG